jgi:hypothetical protein
MQMTMKRHFMISIDNSSYKAGIVRKNSCGADVQLGKKEE